jgi:hypothetical protein
MQVELYLSSIATVTELGGKKIRVADSRSVEKRGLKHKGLVSSIGRGLLAGRPSRDLQFGGPYSDVQEGFRVITLSTIRRGDSTLMGSSS